MPGISGLNLHMALTRRGIEYDLEKSPYRVKSQHLIFHFSSELYRSKFVDECKDYIQFISESLYKRFKFLVRFDELALLVLYRNIEKRGFYVIIKDTKEVITCPEQVKLSGTKVMRLS